MGGSIVKVGSSRFNRALFPADGNFTAIAAGTNVRGIILRTFVYSIDNAVGGSFTLSVGGAVLLQDQGVNAAAGSGAAHCFERDIEIPPGQAVQVQISASAAGVAISYDIL